MDANVNNPWEMENLSSANAGERFAGALGAEDSGAHVHRHDRFSKEWGLVCLDIKRSSVVRVVDYQRDEYWGERVLVVALVWPMPGRGLRWEAKQSELVELGQAFQGAKGLAALRDIGPQGASNAVKYLQAAWESALERHFLEEASSSSSSSGKKSSKPL